MNLNIPDQKEIRAAFAEGEEAVVELFGGVSAQLEKQAEVLKENCIGRMWLRPTASRIIAKPWV